MLSEKLGTYYSSEIHTSLDLSMRPVTGDKGSLCGLAAVYQAALQTILTKSEMKQMSFDEVKAKLGEKIAMDATTTKATFDDEFLNLYLHGNITHINTGCTDIFNQIKIQRCVLVLLLQLQQQQQQQYHPQLYHIQLLVGQKFKHVECY